MTQTAGAHAVDLDRALALADALQSAFAAQHDGHQRVRPTRTATSTR